MEENTIPVKPGSDKPPPSETISELAHRHLLDPNHETTDEELRNVKMGFDTDAGHQLDDAAAKLDDEEKADGSHFEDEKDSDDEDKLPGEKNIVVTPWNLTN